RDLKAQAGAIAQVLEAARAIGWGYCGLTWSPLVGPAGNLEYLLWLKMDADNPEPNLEQLQQITQAAQQDLVKTMD
nr:TlyA family rRNA (cytidine-2'-O)-methyltransferase [Oculatellaceae cyanobacterium Prado106]